MSQYLIAYNNTQGFDANSIHQVIIGIQTINDWWHYLPNLYIVTTSNTAQQIANQIIPKFNGLLFLVIRLDMRDYNGVLNKDAWEWIREKNNQILKFKTVPRADSGTLPPIPPLLSSYLFPLKPTVKPFSFEDFLKFVSRPKK